MSRLVIDASAYFPILVLGSVPGPLAVLELVAPPLIMSETLSAIRESAWRGTVTEDDAQAAVDRLHGADVTVITDERLPALAYEVARDLGWVKTYDAEYVALARLLDAPLFTRDLRLQRGAQRLVTFFEPS